MKTVKIGLIGLGIVGGGVYEAIRDNGKMISRRAGVSLEIAAVCDKDEKLLKKAAAGKSVLRTQSAGDVMKRKDIDVIVELIGGVGAAKNIIISALRHKKHVVTANKALLSEHWKEIFSVASENRMFVNFEASVGGAIPIIRAIRQSFVANNIERIYGILNGTTNFILSSMSESGCSFNDALKMAQEKGIAESNPELDISGKDSAHKLAILSLLGFGQDISPADVYTEGITGIKPEDINNAKRWGYSVKLLAIAKNDRGGLQLRVHPTLLKSSHILSDVRGADNAVLVKGDLADESILFGKGAGREPTASSVVSDIVEIAKHIAFAGRENPVEYRLNYSPGKRNISRIEDLKVPFYLKFSVIDKPGVLASISSILAKYRISIATVAQEERREGEAVPVIILTHVAKEGNMREAIKKIDKMEYITAKTVVLRIEE